MPDVDKTHIARAVEEHTAGSVGLFAENLFQEAASWVTRIISRLGRSKSAKPAASETVDGVILDQIQNGNVAQLGPELVAMEAWKDLGLSAVIAVRCQWASPSTKKACPSLTRCSKATSPMRKPWKRCSIGSKPRRADSSRWSASMRALPRRIPSRPSNPEARATSSISFGAAAPGMRRNLKKTALRKCPDARRIKRWRFDPCGD